jgi:CheY-like chemotaxis protein
MDGFQLAETLQKSPYRAGALVLMVTSGERPGDLERARKAGVSNYLLKPVRRVELKEAVVKALGRQKGAPGNSASAEARVSASPPAVSHLRILLAEDNIVNQRLIQRMLEKKGHQVSVVGDGRQAIRALEPGRFDLILMDVQMPDVDGLDATRSIRAAEKSGDAHIPIVALTAHAMKGDQEKCLAAGMDAYLSKPIHAADLLKMVESYGKRECLELRA